MNTSPPVSPAFTSATPSAKVGRPSAFSMVKIHAICALIRAQGLSDCAAAAQVGVPHTTLSRWKAQYEEVALELERARVLYELPRLRQIAQTRRKAHRPGAKMARSIGAPKPGS